MSSDTPTTDKALLAVLAEHRQNVVTEGVANGWLTRVKCDGEGCHFYAENRSYWAAVAMHDEHLATEVEHIVAARAAASLRLAADQVASELGNEASKHTSTYSVRKWLHARADAPHTNKGAH